MDTSNLPLQKMTSRTTLCRALFRGIYVVLLLNAMSSVLLAKTVLLVIDQPSITASESSRKSQFESWGYTVATIQDSSSQSSFNTAMAAADVVYIPSTVQEWQLVNKCKLTSAGVVCEERYLDVHMGFSTALGWNAVHTQIEILSNTHEVTAGLPLGYVTIVNSSSGVVLLNPTLATGMEVLAKQNYSIGNMLGVIESGGSLAGGGVAAGRRVRMPWGSDSFNWSALNSNGLLIAEQALDWASSGNEALLAHWKFNEGAGTTLVDATGNGNNASFSTGTPAWVSGVRYGALEFDGSNDATTNSTFDPPGTSTVAFWFRGAGVPASLQRLFGITTRWEVTFKTDGTLGFDLGDGATFSSDIVFDEPGRWHHLVAITNASADTFSLYVDGKFVKSESHSITDEPAGTLSFGTRTGMTDRFDGALDDIRIYNYELSEAEIAEVYGLIGHWKMNEGAGSIAADSSGMANDATLHGATWTSNCQGTVGLEFDGTNDTVTTDSDFAPPDVGAVAFWMRGADTPAARGRLFGVNGNWEARQETDGSVSFDLGASPYVGNEPFATPVVDDVNRWYHVIATFDASDDSYTVYVNGVLEAAGISPVDFVAQTKGILTFGSRTGSTEYWVGAMRDFRIYNRPLLEHEIVDQSGVLAYWRLDETSGSVAVDSSAAQNDASYIGGPSLGVAGALPSETATGVELNGVSQSIASGTSLLNNVEQFTIAGWFRPDITSPDRSLVGQNDLIELGIDYSINQIDFWTSNGGSISATAYMPPGKWTHLLATGDGTGLKIYVNGSELASGGSSTTNYGSNSYTLKIGEGVLDSSGDYFDGRIDEVLVYSRAVCGEEALGIYRRGRPVGVKILKWVEVR